MSEVDPIKLLDALRQLGVDVPNAFPTTLSQFVEYWHVYCGAFDTMVDGREAKNQDEALDVAVSALQPWYVRKISFAETPHVESSNRNEYIDWLKRGVS